MAPRIAGNETDAIVDGVGTAGSFSSLNHIASDGTYLYLTGADTLRRIEKTAEKVETMCTLSFTVVALAVVARFSVSSIQ